MRLKLHFTDRFFSPTFKIILDANLGMTSETSASALI